MSRPVVSVVMPVRNAERFLSEAIESVLSQTFRDFEFIVADFGSADKSKDLACRYARKDSRVKLHEVPPGNLPRARNSGCSVAQGRYIAVMDADDVCLPDRLRRELDYLESHPAVGVVGGATEWIDASGNFLRRHHYPAENREIKAELQTNCPFCHPTVLMRRDAFEQVGRYREAFALAHDYDLLLRTSERWESTNLQEPVLRYRIHSHQVSQNKRTQQTMCILAAQASASARRAGRPDPLDASGEITATGLGRMGVTKAAQQSRLALEVRRSIRWMCLTGENSAALSTAVEFLKSGLTLVEPWQIAELQFTAAKLFWKRGKPWNSLLAVARAVAIRPLMLARPLKLLWHSLGPVKRSARR
ncbi:MAG: glycosyltransferase [Acidobacteriia bacterium]|nr:glycosyltransferase [Terriglobia bacterium]